MKSQKDLLRSSSSGSQGKANKWEQLNPRKPALDGFAPLGPDFTYRLICGVLGLSGLRHRPDAAKTKVTHP